LKSRLSKRAMTIAASRKSVIAVSQEKRVPRLKKRFKVEINEKLCKGCYFCIRFCPVGVFVRSDVIGDLGYNLARVEFPEKCTGCKACLLYCPDLATAVEEEKEAEGNK
jgi:2-oxoglutarate ferredoxin oxidoreductase subunit delta